MARRTKEDAEKTRLKILKAALDIFSKKGYDKTTFQKIADRIKLSKGAIYWHFSSKPELLKQLVVYIVDEAIGDQRIINSQPENFDELRTGLKEWMARVIEVPANRKHIKMLLNLDWSRPALKNVGAQLKILDNSLINVTATAFRSMQARGELRPGVDVMNVAYMIGLTWIGMLHCRLGADDMDYDVDAVFDCLIDSVEKNIRAQ
ncbi:MAG: TetR/AcrR family transcriptional regulator [Kiritimatiellia bacterium]